MSSGESSERKRSWKHENFSAFIYGRQLKSSLRDEDSSRSVPRTLMDSTTHPSLYTIFHFSLFSSSSSRLNRVVQQRMGRVLAKGRAAKNMFNQIVDIGREGTRCRWGQKTLYMNASRSFSFPRRSDGLKAIFINFPLKEVRLTS